MLRVLDRGSDCVLPSGRGWVTACPAHADRERSLFMAHGEDGRALLTCRAGCSQEEVLAALDLAPADLLISAGDLQRMRPGVRGIAPFAFAVFPAMRAKNTNDASGEGDM